MMIPIPDLLRHRRKEISERKQALRDEILRLEAEEADLRIAERVVGRLSCVASGARVPGRDQDELPIPKKGPSKPDGSPTVPEMILGVLSDAESIGIEGLAGRGVISEIRRRWWPNVGWNNVLPILHRMLKRGQLVRKGELFCIAKNETPNAGTLGVSQANEGGSSLESSSSDERVTGPLVRDLGANQATPEDG